MAEDANRNPNPPSRAAAGSGRGRWTPPTAKGCSWERCSRKAVINHRIFGPLCWRHMKIAKLSICVERVRPNDRGQARCESPKT